jgi:ferredoxin
MKVTASRDKCIGSGLCCAVAQEVFDQDRVSGLVILLNDRPSPAVSVAVREAAYLCPSGAIEIK